MNKRQRPYTDSTGLEHNGHDYQNGWDNEMERRSEEDRLNRIATADEAKLWYETKYFKPDIGHKIYVKKSQKGNWNIRLMYSRNDYVDDELVHQVVIDESGKEVFNSKPLTSK